MTPEERAERAAEQLVKIRQGGEDVAHLEHVKGRVFVIIEGALCEDDSNARGMIEFGQNLRDRIAEAMVSEIHAAIVAEREACAELVEQFYGDLDLYITVERGHAQIDIADPIRARQ